MFIPMALVDVRAAADSLRMAAHESDFVRLAGSNEARVEGGEDTGLCRTGTRVAMYNVRRT
jgi:hypothetical protein